MSDSDSDSDEDGGPPLEPIHFAVMAGVEPALQVLFVFAQFCRANTQLLKAQFARELANLLG